MGVSSILGALRNRHHVVSGGDLGRIRTVKAPRDGNALNKAGRLVLRAEHEGRPVKLFEAANSDHARFIRAIADHNDLGPLFPRVLFLRGRLVVTEWVVEGETRPIPLSDLAAMQARVHASGEMQLSDSAFDYWMDFIWPRFQRAADVLSIGDVAIEVGERVGTFWRRQPSVFMHPDLTRRNVVNDSTSSWRIIDNELLTVGGFPLLDVCNTAQSLQSDEGRGQEYFRLYRRHRNIEVGDEEIQALQMAWLARRVGSMAVSGRFDRAAALVQQFRSGVNILPFDPGTL